MTYLADNGPSWLDRRTVCLLTGRRGKKRLFWVLTWVLPKILSLFLRIILMQGKYDVIVDMLSTNHNIRMSTLKSRLREVVSWFTLAFSIFCFDLQFRTTVEKLSILFNNWFLKLISTTMSLSILSAMTVLVYKLRIGCWEVIYKLLRYMLFTSQPAWCGNQ